LVEQQQEMEKIKLVMDGRYRHGCFKDAELKIFMTARQKLAQRRFDELEAKGEKVTLEVLKMYKRDCD
jgi:cytidylate kinase